jgi:hypothetical protein
MNGKNLPRPLARKILFSITFLITTLLVTACGGGSSGSNSGPITNEAATGEIIIGLTDAEGDFHSYTLDVLSVKLIRQNGAEVETLPLSTRVDFAQYTELTEFLTAATVPTGIYTGASLLVDYSNADIIVEDEFGNGVEAVAVDGTGGALQQLELRVEFESTDTLRIAPGIPAHITLDFDLAASNRVDLSVAPAVVTVEPVLMADTILEDPKPHRLRGLLNTVSVDADVFSIFIRPFFHHHGDFGSLRVHSTNDTAYEIDMTSYSGHAGIEALALLDPRSPIIVLGELNRDTRRFIATDVVAGTSVPWGDSDSVNGNVLARLGNELTLSRVVRSRADNQVRHQQLITVLLGPDTVVKQQGVGPQNLGIDAISIGQRLQVMGEFSDDFTLDATEGRVRMLFTHLSGTSVSDQPLVVDLQAIDRRRPSLFDFTGTGSTENADPANYEIDTSSLSLSALSIGEPLRVIGHVRPFGSAPEDFSAQTVVALGNLPAKLLVNWVDGAGTAPFVSQSDTAIVVDLDPAKLGSLHAILRAGIGIDLLDLDQDLTLMPNSSGSGIFILTYQGRVRQYRHFDRYSEALAELLNGVNQVQGLSAHGSFEDSSATLTVRKVVTRVN